MRPQQIAKSSWNSEGFHADNYLKEAISKHQEWSVRITSRITSVLVKDKYGWGIAKSTPPIQRVVRVIAAEQLKFDFSVERTFRVLADKWLEDTKYISNLNKAIAHPAYQQIIGMGKAAREQITTLLLKELEVNPDHWLVALSQITGEDPAKPDDNFEEATKAWLTWGRKRGYLTYTRP